LVEKSSVTRIYNESPWENKSIAKQSFRTTGLSQICKQFLEFTLIVITGVGHEIMGTNSLTCIVAVFRVDYGSMATVACDV